MEKTTFVLKSLSYRAGGREVLHQLDTSIAEGKITAIVGPNGSGKSTLLKLLAGLEPATSGELSILGRPAAKWPRQQLAKELAMLPQSSPVPMAISVRELVACGRFPWVGSFGRMTAEDHQAVDEALERTGMAALADRDVNNLSGGERQRVWLALTLAQQTRVLLLDEPTSWLDIGHQLRLVDIVQTLNREKKVTVVWVLHDLNQAARYSDNLLVMQQGRLVRQGTSAEVMDQELLQSVFGVHAAKYSDSSNPDQKSDAARDNHIWVPELEYGAA
ncbi:ABC transporter ATP-binding protein [Endozoicomonadaceae bacterium StTr2]